MIKNYLKIAWRTLVKSKVSSLINIGGLAVGMAVAMLIGLWVWDELSFDTYHKNYKTIGYGIDLIFIGDRERILPVHPLTPGKIGEGYMFIAQFDGGFA